MITSNEILTFFLIAVSSGVIVGVIISLFALIFQK